MAVAAVAGVDIGIKLTAKQALTQYGVEAAGVVAEVVMLLTHLEAQEALVTMAAPLAPQVAPELLVARVAAVLAGVPAL